MWIKGHSSRGVQACWGLAGSILPDVRCSRLRCSPSLLSIDYLKKSTLNVIRRVSRFTGACRLRAWPCDAVLIGRRYSAISTPSCSSSFPSFAIDPSHCRSIPSSFDNSICIFILEERVCLVYSATGASTAVTTVPKLALRPAPPQHPDSSTSAAQTCVEKLHSTSYLQPRAWLIRGNNGNLPHPLPRIHSRFYNHQKRKLAAIREQRRLARRIMTNIAGQVSCIASEDGESTRMMHLRQVSQYTGSRDATWECMFTNLFHI